MFEIDGMRHSTILHFVPTDLSGPGAAGRTTNVPGAFTPSVACMTADAMTSSRVSSRRAAT